MKFIYPKNIDATMVEGTATTSVFTAGTAFTNPYHANDENTVSLLGSVAVADSLRFEFDSAEEIVAMANYIGTIDATAVMSCYRSTNGTDLTFVGDLSNSGNLGWYLLDIDTSDAKYWVMRVKTAATLDLSQVFFGTTLDFPVNIEKTIETELIYGSTYKKGLLGAEFTNKRYGELFVKKIKFEKLSTTQLGLFTTMFTAINGRRTKLLWYDDTDYHWIKITNDLKYKTSGNNKFDLELIIEEQIV